MSGSFAVEQEPQEPVDLPEHKGSQTVSQSIREPPTPKTALEPTPESEEDAAQESDEGSYYWDASTMAPLNAASAAAIARLRAYKPPPFPLWDRLPLSRRAAVLMLLYADRRGDLRVVITMRAASLRSFSGHAALPGGKADTLAETPYQIARREAWEEIGLPMDDAKLPAPFRIEHLCCLPMNLARTELVVRPCVALLHTATTTTTTTTDPPSSSPPPPSAAASASAAAAAAARRRSPTADESLIPRLDAKEVAAVFSAPFRDFLRATPDDDAVGDGEEEGRRWYEGSWTEWHGEPWRVHYFHVPVTDQAVVKPPAREGGLAALDEEGEEEGGKGPGRYKVWGMTARILVDAARVAYGEEPEFEHNAHFGDEGIIAKLEEMGRLGEKKRQGSVVSGEGLKRVKEAVVEAVGDAIGEGEGRKGEASKM